MMLDDSWKREAKCQGQDPKLWYLDHLDTALGQMEKRQRLQQHARKACAGCRVLVQCARDAWKSHDEYVIRAGVPLRPGSIIDDRERLRQIFDVDNEHVPKPPSELVQRHWKDKRCTRCGWLMRPKGAGSRYWPDTKRIGAGTLCMACYKANAKEKNGHGKTTRSPRSRGGVAEMGEAATRSA